ncbi:MAG: sugar transferase [Actinobacteria bacterium]|nr:sugar transferase [Actinomycetota bacterium]
MLLAAWSDPYLGVAAGAPRWWLVAGWLGVLALSGAHDARRLDGAAAAELARVLRGSAWVAFATVLLGYLALQWPGRFGWSAGAGADPGLALVTVPTGTALLLAGRVTVRAGLALARRRGRCRHRVLAVGTVRDVVHLVEQARRSPGAGFDVTAACVPHGGPVDRRSGDRRDSPASRPEDQRAGDRRAESDRRGELAELFALGVRVLGGPHDVLPALAESNADTVVVAGPGVLGRHAVRRLAWQLEGGRVRLYVGSSLTEVATPRISLDSLGGMPLLRLRAPTFGGVRRLFKEVLDRLGAGVLVLLLAPVLLGLAVAVRLTSAGPVLYRQRRVGLGGREFHCLKLRTMRVGADREVVELRQRSISGDVLFKVRDDPRVTRVGRVLRRYSLDELPQLFNVLGGSMSLVGPRPPLPAEVARYGEDVHRRLLVKPGMTGLWQVAGRSDLSWPESVRLDLYYVENWSPYLDLSLLARTVLAVLRGRGAY